MLVCFNKDKNKRGGTEIFLKYQISISLPCIVCLSINAMLLTFTSSMLYLLLVVYQYPESTSSPSSSYSVT